MTSDLKITLKNVNFTIEGNQFFKNLNLKFSSYGISVILGPNGSGKTLLLNLIMGLIKPKCGEINFADKGRNITKSFVSQKITMLRRSVRDNLCFPLKIEGKKENFIEDRVQYFLKKFDITDLAQRSARKLSSGKKQYISIIRSLTLDSKILILDEPCANLDNISTQKIEDFLLAESKKKKILVVTHDIFQAKRLADEIIFLNQGKVVAQKSKKDFFSSQSRLIKKFSRGYLI